MIEVQITHLVLSCSYCRCALSRSDAVNFVPVLRSQRWIQGHIRVSDPLISARREPERFTWERGLVCSFIVKHFFRDKTVDRKASLPHETNFRVA